MGMNILDKYTNFGGRTDTDVTPNNYFMTAHSSTVLLIWQ